MAFLLHFPAIPVAEESKSGLVSHWTDKETVTWEGGRSPGSGLPLCLPGVCWGVTSSGGPGLRHDQQPNPAVPTAFSVQLATLDWSQILKKKSSALEDGGGTPDLLSRWLQCGQPVTPSALLQPEGAAWSQPSQGIAPEGLVQEGSQDPLAPYRTL